MKIAVTGVSGFIGLHLTPKLSEIDNAEIYPFDKKKHSLFNTESLKDFVENKDVIIHLAGLLTSENTSDFYTLNSIGTLNLLGAISRYGKSGVHFIFPSSFAVYKEISQKKLLDEEKTKTIPRNHYGMSKLFAEEIIKFYNRNNQIKTGILRLANVYGPGTKQLNTSVTASFIDKIAHNEKIIVNGDGKQMRDFIYISDVVNAFIKTINYQKESFLLVNICSGKEITIIDLIRRIEKIMGKKAIIEYNRKCLEKGYFIGNNKLAFEKINFKPKIDFDAGLRKTIIQYLTNSI